MTKFGKNYICHVSGTVPEVIRTDWLILNGQLHFRHHFDPYKYFLGSTIFEKWMNLLLWFRSKFFIFDHVESENLWFWECLVFYSPDFKRTFFQLFIDYLVDFYVLCKIWCIVYSFKQNITDFHFQHGQKWKILTQTIKAKFFIFQKWMNLLL